MGPTSVGPSAAAAEGRRAAPPSENPWSVWRLGSCGTWHLPAAAVALRCQVAHSPDRKPARPLPRLGGVEPQTAGQRPLLALTAQRPRRSFLWVDDAPQARSHLSPCRCPAGFVDRVAPMTHRTEVDSLQQPYPATSAAPRRLSKVGDCRAGSLLPLRVPGGSGDVLLLDPGDEAVGVVGEVERGGRDRGAAVVDEGE
jgi:hypothetical protein